MKTVIFTVTPGHTGTTFLCGLLRNNLQGADAYHELIFFTKGMVRIGIDSPDASHFQRFNVFGADDPKVRAFWHQKFYKIKNESDGAVYAETSHLLAKAGLMENLHFFDGWRYKIILLRRSVKKICLSMKRRNDYGHRWSVWTQWLDPKYPKNMLGEGFVRYLAGRCKNDFIYLWYVLEMMCRQEYYRAMFVDDPDVDFIDADIDDLNTVGGARSFLKALGLKSESVYVPSKKNTTKPQPGDNGLSFDVDDVLKGLNFDPVKIASAHLKQGRRF